MLERKHFHYVHEAGGHLLIGVLCGLVLNVLYGTSSTTAVDLQSNTEVPAQVEAKIIGACVDAASLSP